MRPSGKVSTINDTATTVITRVHHSTTITATVLRNTTVTDKVPLITMVTPNVRAMNYGRDDVRVNRDRYYNNKQTTVKLAKRAHTDIGPVPKSGHIEEKKKTTTKVVINKISVSK